MISIKSTDKDFNNLSLDLCRENIRSLLKGRFVSFNGLSGPFQCIRWNYNQSLSRHTIHIHCIPYTPWIHQSSIFSFYEYKRWDFCSIYMTFRQNKILGRNSHPRFTNKECSFNSSSHFKDINNLAYCLSQPQREPLSVQTLRKASHASM